jgi:hypothetical protein
VASSTHKKKTKVKQKSASELVKNIPDASTKNPETIAVIIGNKNYSRYNSGIPDVNFAASDAAAVKQNFIQLLGILPENIIYLEDATQANMISIFGSEKNYKGKLYNWVKPNVSKVIVYYSGHGAPSLNKKGAYLVPVDASVSYISETGYSVDTLYKNLGKIPSVQNFVILDACFSGDSGGGALFKNVSPALYKTSSHIKNLKKSYLISSTSVGELSNWYPKMKHSLFTYYFIKGLQGEADTNKDKDITMLELQNYVQSQVSYRARRLNGMEQHPVFVADNKSNVIVYLK